MACRTMHFAAQRQLALVTQHRLEFGRLTDHAQQRLDRLRVEPLDQRAYAQAANLFVIGQRDMHRHPQRRLHQRRHLSQYTRDEALHIGRATAIQLAVLFREVERRDRPMLAIHRHPIRVAGQHNAGQPGRADGCQQVGLALLLIEQQLRGHPVALQIGAHEVDQGQVGFTAGGIKAHQVRQQLTAVAHRSSPGTA